MKNSNISEKSKGVVIFANNTENVDYISIAEKSARLIEYNLELPVTIISSNSKQNTNRRYNIDSHIFETWNNYGRYCAYDLSPYCQTLLLDCDYLVFDKKLLKLFKIITDYKIVKDNIFIDSKSVTSMGPYSLPNLWATVICFNKTPKTKLLFELVARIEKNYSYYRKLYNIQLSNFRNDYAFTIADNIINGYIQDPENYIPWPIFSVTEQIKSLVLVNDNFHIKTSKSSLVMPKQDLHILSKSWLQSKQFDELLETTFGKNI